MKDLLKKGADLFNKESKLVKIIILIIPFVGWVFEICVRWNHYFEKKSTLSLIVALVVVFFGMPFGWVDLVWILLFDRLVLAND